jgi:hypothetical protein
LLPHQQIGKAVSDHRHALGPVRPNLREKNPALGVELGNLGLPARLLTHPAGKNRGRAVEQLLSQA